MKNKILYERSLRTCIIMLVVCIVFKLFGAEWFDLNTSIPILQGLNKTNEFNENATNKTTSFNDNATSKTNTFNQTAQ